MVNYHLLSIEDTFKKLKSDKYGLSEKESSLRINKFGKNAFDKQNKTSLFIRFIQQIIDPMIIILLSAAIISALLSVAKNESFTDVFIILVVVIINAILGVYQESKAEKSLDSLKKMTASRSTVIRDSKAIEILSEMIVPGDIVVLQTGDYVPADGRIIESVSLKIDESALTGESTAISKIIDMLQLKCNVEEISIADRLNMAYMGTSVCYGRGLMLVTSTGMNTEMGKIAGALQNVEKSKTPLQIKMNQLSKILTWLVLGICIVVFVVQLIHARNFNFQFILDSFMIAITLAVAAIPEGLPAIVTIALSIGVSKMSKRNAIVRKLTAVETLGCSQIICSDKTGTLTKNEMTVTDWYSFDDKFLSLGMALCCDAKYQNNKYEGEATEIALVRWAKDSGYDLSNLSNDYVRKFEIPFDSNRKMMTTINEVSKNKNLLLNHLICRLSQLSFIQFTKGAPDVILNNCTKIYYKGQIVDMTDTLKNKILNSNKKMADRALRVLALSVKFYDKIPKDKNSINLENQMVFIGLAGMIDIVRPEVKDSIVKCKNAGIRTIMITGDHVDTAKAIAIELGILEKNNISLTGAQLSNMDKKQFNKCFKDVSVYARVLPEHKTRIVKAWQNAGYVVAMTGDGVNDAPSIKTADIGVGMGITGTDVSKNAADIVLADDNFATIVGAVEEGRRIYDNIIKSIQYLLSSNIGEVLGVFFASILGFTILRPLHLLWVNLVTDCIPALALGTEAKEPNLMNKKPRPKNSGIFSDGVLFDILYQGFFITFLIGLSYLLGHYFEFGYLAFSDSEHGITMAFLTMSMVGCFHSINLRSRRQSIFKLKSKNWILFASVFVSLILTTIVCEVPAIADSFKLVEIDLKEWLVAVFLSLLIIPIVEIVKFIIRKWKNK